MFVVLLALGSLAAQELEPLENPPLDALGASAAARPVAPHLDADGSVVTLPALEAGPPAGAAGVHRDLPEDAMARGQWAANAAGEWAWRLTVKAEDASSLRLRFVVEQEGGELRLHGSHGSSSHRLHADFWSDVVEGSSVLVEFVPEPATGEALPFRIEKVSHGVSSLFVCPDDGAGCGGIWREARRGVARLRYENEAASAECGAWLINTRTSRAIPYLLAGCALDPAQAATAVAIFDSGEQRRVESLLTTGAGVALLALDRAPDNAYFLGWAFEAESVEFFPVALDGAPAARKPGVAVALRQGDAALPFSAVYPQIRDFLEDGEPCGFQLSSTESVFGPGGGSGEFVVHAGQHCQWGGASSAPWVAVSNEGGGEGVFRFRVAGNVAETSREAVITLAGRVHRVLQSGVSAADCREERMELGKEVDGSLDTNCVSVARPGRFAKRYAFQGQKDQRLVIAAESTAFDAYIYLLDQDKRILLQDDDGGEGTAARLPAVHGSFALPYTGEYSVEVTSAASAAVGEFRLAACPGQTPIAIQSGQTLSGTLTPQSCLSTEFYTQLYSFQGTTTHLATVTMDSNAIDSYLIVSAPNGNVIGEDDDSGGGLNARVGPVVLPQTGAYIIEASTWEPRQTGSFTVSLTVTPPSSDNTGSRFVPVTPCRIADTRTGQGKTGNFGPPRLSANQVRELPIPSGSCGIPSGAKAYSLNITVVPAEPLGYLTAWATGQTRPEVSTLNSFDGRIVANAAIVPASANGSISIFVTNPTDVIVDINGYFAP